MTQSRPNKLGSRIFAHIRRLATSLSRKSMLRVETMLMWLGPLLSKVSAIITQLHGMYIIWCTMCNQCQWPNVFCHMRKRWREVDDTSNKTRDAKNTNYVRSSRSRRPTLLIKEIFVWLERISHIVVRVVWYLILGKWLLEKCLLVHSRRSPRTGPSFTSSCKLIARNSITNQQF